MLLSKRVSLNAGDHLSLSYYGALLMQPLLWLGIVLSVLQLWTWTRILALTELSLAYPITSLAYPLTMIAAVIFFHEHLSVTVWIGAILISTGVALVGGSRDKSPQPQEGFSSIPADDQKSVVAAHPS